MEASTDYNAYLDEWSKEQRDAWIEFVRQCRTVPCLRSPVRYMRDIEKQKRPRPKKPRKWWRSSSLEQTEEDIIWGWNITPKWSLRYCFAGYVLQWFPHATNEIAHTTAHEFGQWGYTDAERRGIGANEWLWKRSRFLAGHQ